MESLVAYQQKKAELVKDLRSASDQAIGLNKSTSNLFRQRQQSGAHKIDVKHFNNVISVDKENMIAEVEGMTTYEALVDETLRQGLLPTVVPELKSITIGGAVSGVGIESSSFKYGLVHETILEIEVLLGDGRVVACTPDNEFRDLFYGFPNSYGTLGYILKLKVKLRPTQKYVKLEHRRYNQAEKYFKDLGQFCAAARTRDGGYDFIDGTIFDSKESYITLGTFVAEAPFVSDYTYRRIYFRSLQEKKIDYLTTLHYIWRWDSDWFWCSKHFYMQNPVMRLLFGKFALRSTVYWKISAWSGKLKILGLIQKALGQRTESVIQDVQIPLENCAAFMDFFHQEIGIKPVWVCPVTAYDKKISYDLYPMDSTKLYMNFGFWDTVRSDRKEGYYNKMIERKVEELAGKKSLYSTSYYSPEKFWELYNKKAYDVLKAKYDSVGRFRDLYTKCVKRK
ncbi:MAG: FAD-binding oxidoreductase [Parcubacteria group bacterium]|nr:FAD-binding oxidoreductase [Parcubacteria group bacterium]